MPVFGFERVCIGVEGKAGMRRSSRTTASISNAAIRVKARAMEAENRCAMGIVLPFSDFDASLPESVEFE